MKKIELIAICKFLMQYFKKDNFRMYCEINEFMLDVVNPLSQAELDDVDVDNGEIVPNSILLFMTLLEYLRYPYTDRKD